MLQAFIRSFNASPQSLHDALYLGTVEPTVYEAYHLYNDLINYVRFDHPMRHESLYCEDTLELVYSYMLLRLAMFRIAPYIGAYPMPAKYKFSSELNRHIYKRFGIAGDLYR